jgi:hypothetical protein
MKLILALFTLSAIIIVGATVMTYVQLSPTNEVILHFDTAGQPDFTGSQRDVLLLLASGGGMLLINFFLANVFDKREHFTALVISNFSLILSVLLFIATYVIISNNR